ncbi:hypothetical protein PPUN15366_31500 [Pseudomonas putida]|nr:hypothetical protein PPUN15366_31500 [Pseudomonas putida]
MLLANGIAEQLTQHMDIFTQTHIDIGHWPSLRRGSGALHSFSAFTRSHKGARYSHQECPQPGADGKP